MAGSNVNSGDDMIRRLEEELRQKQNFANEIIGRAQTAERDLSDEEKSLIAETRGRIEQIKDQLDTIEDVTRVSFESSTRARQVGQAIESMRTHQQVSPVEYRSAGAYALDMYQSHLGDRKATERLELFYRSADHQKTSDNLGVVPDLIVGDVINFIDAGRPITTAIGPRPLPGATWHRPIVTQQPSVGVQGSAGAAADEKTDLVSQKMLLTRLTGNAVTYGGYVNVSRQNIDFSNPQILDIIINGLASQYAIDTEAAVGDALADTNTAAVTYSPGSTVAESQYNASLAVWQAAALVYQTVRGQGSLVLAVSPDVLGTFGPLFAPVGPQNQYGGGFNANAFGQGAAGNISGITTVMSAGLGAGEAYLFSTAAIEVYEQRIGTLQVTEPSVLGVQVAYAGYFTPMVLDDGGIVPITGAGS